MMDRKRVLLPLLALASTSLSGCVAAVIPAIAGSAVVGSRVDGKGAGEEGAVAATPPPAPQAVAAAPTPTPPPPPPVVQAPVASVAAAVPPPPPPARVAPPSSAVPVATAYPDPARPLPPEHLGFARFVRFGQASAIGAKGGADLPSAILSDPVALDGKRRRCTPGEQLVALIDLDPNGGVFRAPANPAEQPGLALGLAVLRDAGVEIAWLSDLSTTQSGALRTALEQSGLDPRGEDIISLRRDEADTKQKRKDSLAGITCIVAIAGDERPDFYDRYKYLRSPEAGEGLEPLIGDGWFLIEPLLGK